MKKISLAKWYEDQGGSYEGYDEYEEWYEDRYDADAAYEERCWDERED